MNQNEQIQRMSPSELMQALFLSQLLFFTIAIIGSFFFFDSLMNWLDLFYWDLKSILLLGSLSGAIIVIINIILEKILPPSMLDDGGMNRKIFENQSVWAIFWITLWIAISEEMLFRGLLQTTFGLIPASIIFAVVHVRYLKKPVLLTVVVLMSFYLGYTYYITNNLLIPIVIHFIIDFCLGIYIRNKK